MILLVLIVLLYILFAKSFLFDLIAKITSRDISTQYTIPVGTISFVLQFTICALAGFEHNKFLVPLPGIGNIDINLIFTFLRLVIFPFNLLALFIDFSGFTSL